MTQEGSNGKGRTLARVCVRKDEYKSGAEAAFASILAQLVANGLIVWQKFEPITLRLARHTTYTPDFLVINKDAELIAIEVKGYPRDDAMVKLKVAAEQFPWMRFILARATKKAGRYSFALEEVGVAENNSDCRGDISGKQLFDEWFNSGEVKKENVF